MVNTSNLNFTNVTTCPLTVLLNVLVIMAVKRRPRLQSNTNILLACLAATDVFTGLTAQPSFIMWKIFELLGLSTESETFLQVFHRCSIRAVSICFAFHLRLVTCKRLFAIKFTMRFPHIVTKRNIKVAVTVVWIVALFCGASRSLDGDVILTPFNLFAAFTFFQRSFHFRFLLNFISWITSPPEEIKTQQMRQEQVKICYRNQSA